MSPPLRGITLTHPFAFCIQRLGKPLENRGWPPQKDGGCVGMFLAVHGGNMPRGEKREEAEDAIRWVMREVIAHPRGDGRWRYRRDWWAELTPDQQAWLSQKKSIEPGDWYAPGIVAVARLARVVRNSRSRWAKPGEFQWVLDQVMPLDTPLPYSGSKGLWEIESYTYAQLQDRWAQAHDGCVPF